MKVSVRVIKQKFPNSKYFAIFKDSKSEAIIRKSNEMVPGSGRISPFSGYLYDLIKAVALKGKPIADFSYRWYAKEKDLCDYIIEIYGIEKQDDLKARCIWIFRTENKDDAFNRISKLKEIFKHRTLTSEDHRKMGVLYGYSERDIEKFFALRKVKNSRK
ncbi:MAG TPA: hypothetical protein VIJ14_06185 [Rhabdochlamydiaceae bacterium]